MRSHLVVLTSEMYMSNTWHLTLELSLKLYRVKDYRLHGVCSPPFYFITQDISPQKSPQTKKQNKKNPEPFFQAQRAKVKQLSVSVMSKDWPDSMALTLQQIDDVKTSGLLGRSDLIKQLPLKTRPLAQLSASDCRKRVEHLTR